MFEQYQDSVWKLSGKYLKQKLWHTHFLPSSVHLDWDGPYCQAQPQFQLSPVPALLGWDSINFNFSLPPHPPTQGKYRGRHFKFVEPSLTVDKWPSTIWPCNICPCNICPCNICPCNICPCNICPCNIFPYNICPGTKFGCLQLQPLLFGPNNQILN